MTVIPLHFDTALASICCFFVAFVACAAGLFSSSFRDNWLQHFGMFAVAVASAMKMFQIYERHYASPETTLLAFGVALFSLGVAWKVFLHARERNHDWQAEDRRKTERRMQG